MTFGNVAVQVPTSSGALPMLPAPGQTRLTDCGHFSPFPSVTPYVAENDASAAPCVGVSVSDAVAADTPAPETAIMQTASTAAA